MKKIPLTSGGRNTFDVTLTSLSSTGTYDVVLALKNGGYVSQDQVTLHITVAWPKLPATITSVSPNPVKYGELLTITGKNFTLHDNDKIIILYFL